MADFNEFVPALPFTLNWSLNDNPFDDSDANPKQMSIAIPVKSADALCAHIYKMAADAKYIKKDKKVWNPKTRQEEVGDVIYINAKGKISADGESCYGNINPRKIETDDQF